MVESRRSSLLVVDEKGRPLGRILSDDILDALGGVALGRLYREPPGMGRRTVRAIAPPRRERRGEHLGGEVGGGFRTRAAPAQEGEHPLVV